MHHSFRLVIAIILFSTVFAINANEKERLVILSIDGLGWHELQTFKDDGTLTSGALVQQDLIINKLQVLATGNTGPSHITAYTGVEPKEGGWVGNTYLVQGQSQKTRQSAFTAVKPHSEIKHVVTKIKNKGLSTACLNAPTVNPNLQCDFQLSFSPRVEPSCGFSLTKTNTKLQCGTDNLAIDSNRSTVTFNNVEVTLKEGAVAPMCWSENEKYFSRLLYKETSREGIKLYVGPKHSVNANDAFHREAPSFVCWPGLIDGNSIRLGKISQSGFYKISLYQHDYAMRLLQYVLSMQQYDVVLAYTSFLDKVQHELLSEVVIDSQGNTINFVENAFAVVSDDLKSIIDSLNKNDSMLAFSDHGFQKSDFVVFPNGLLRPFNKNIQNDKKAAQVLVSGALGHIYTNDMSRSEKEQLKTSLLNLEINGQGVFNFVIERGDEGFSDFNHENSGDIVVMVNPGFSLDPRVPPTDRFIYPSMAKPDEKLKKLLVDKEYLFLSKGTSNRVSPGVHGFKSDVAEIDGIIFGTNTFQVLLESGTRSKKISDVTPLIEKAISAH
ncbi:alkaline phosphatase family protein [Alteromonas sp. W364]|uniref:alkaline phosphatase family protein n=1 Tax=Alteromonas sp. W364 TaxID=3075610 RepID=UPI0028856A93|nr:alkaline phosphatase family protein [Alteromonas sp. W364]MDT0628043.1 alkaline phosphatase family protein [Alteromonas sp. W364]